MPYFSDTNLTIYNADVLAGLGLLPGKSVHCAITSPPYWGLRDYGIPPTEWPAVEFIPAAGLPPYTVPAMSSVFGLEPDPWSYVGHSVHVFRQIHRVLRDDGTLWLNLGDSFCSGNVSLSSNRHPSRGQKNTVHVSEMTQDMRPLPSGLKPKDLIGIPWMVAKALQADGWYLRMDAIWAKKNCMPESVNDRPTKSHEYIFLLSKSQRYFYDAEAVKEESITGDERRPYGSLGAWE
jgi:DNA modification methylase